VHVPARAVGRNHVHDFWAVGCRDVIRETYDSSLRMGRSAFEALGATRAQAEGVTAIFNSNDREAMIEVAEHYDPGIPVAENETFIATVRAMSARRRKEVGQQIAAVFKGTG
jgi:CPA2 family monovalent cation:H+ antiporter-2